MAYQASFQCFAGCEGRYPLTQAIYRCPKCQGLLDVVHDTRALADRSPTAWMKLFDDRYKRTTWPYGSGVWGKREWVAPGQLRRGGVGQRHRRIAGRGRLVGLRLAHQA